MSSSWGILINPDKSPAPLLEQLCLGIAQKIPSLDNGVAADLTPERLAAFYRKVGGDYDSLFLQTKSEALSFIYQSLGCFHSLQPSGSPYLPPSVPSLLPTGFIRWQTIQLLMDPDENWQYLQNSLNLWDIPDAQGNFFPKELPRNAFPSEPDPEMLQWHEGVSKRLKHDYEKKCDHEKWKNQHHSPPNFGAWHHTFNSKAPSPDEEEFVSPPPRHSSRPRHHSYADPDRTTGGRRHRRRLSAEYPAFTSRRPESNFRPDGGRSGMTSPRATSPARPERPMRSRGRARESWYARPFSPEAESDAQEADEDDESDDTVHEEFEPRHRHRHHRRNLSPPSHSRARRHSHDAYKRKPARQFSPDAHHRRSHRSHETPLPKSKKMQMPSDSKAYPEERSRSRPRSSIPLSAKFKDYLFDGPGAGPPPAFTTRMAPRTRYNLDPYDEVRRGSHSSGSTNGSRPGSGSSSERARPWTHAGYSPRTARFKPGVPEDAYIPPRRAPIYD